MFLLPPRLSNSELVSGLGQPPMHGVSVWWPNETKNTFVTNYIFKEKKKYGRNTFLKSTVWNFTLPLLAVSVITQTLLMSREAISWELLSSVSRSVT